MKKILIYTILTASLLLNNRFLKAQSFIKFIDEHGLKAGSSSNFNTTSENGNDQGGFSRKLTSLGIKAEQISTEDCSTLQFKYAQIMDVEIENISNLALFEFIEEWWHTKYHYGGKTKDGIDCSGLSSMLCSKVYDLTLPRTARLQYESSEKIERDELKEGDLVFFNTRGGVSHVGVYLYNDYFVHASVRNGVTINNLNESYYKKKYIASGRVKALNTVFF